MTCVKAHYNRDAQGLLCSSHLNQASSCSNVALLLGSITPIVASTALTKKTLLHFIFISKFSEYFELQLTSNIEIKIIEITRYDSYIAETKVESSLKCSEECDWCCDWCRDLP